MKRAGALALGLVVAVVLAELIASWWTGRWLDELVGWMHVDVAMHRDAPAPRLYELRPGWRGAMDNTHTAAVNAMGHRGPERAWDKPAGTLRILALGGSNTFGAGVDDADTWPQLLEDELGGRCARPVEVWNLGVSGYETRQKLALGAAVAPRADPDAILLQVHNIGPRYVLRGSDAMGRLRSDPALLEEWSNLDIGPQSARWMGWSAVARLVILTNARRSRARRPEDPELVSWRRGIAELPDFLAAMDAPVVGIIPPPGVHLFTERGQHRAAVADLEGAGLPVLDLHARAVPALPEIDNIHPGPEAYRWYARTIAPALLAGVGADWGCGERRDPEVGAR